MKKAFKIFSIMFVIEIVLIPIAKANGILGYKRTEPPVLQSLESPVLSNLGNALPRLQDRANIMFNYHLTHKWDQYYH